MALLYNSVVSFHHLMQMIDVMRLLCLVEATRNGDTEVERRGTGEPISPAMAIGQYNYTF